MDNFSNSDNSYRYKLEKGSKKHLCPYCGKKRFVRYIETETGNYLPERYGRCDRESNCGYHLDPYLDSYAKENRITGITKITVSKQKYFRTQSNQRIKSAPVYFDLDTFKQTLQPERYEKNTFIQNLLGRIAFPFEVKDIETVVSLYCVGTIVNGYRARAVTFPFIDKKSNIRAIQVKQFNDTNHTTGTDFLHSIIEKHHTQSKKPLPEWLKAYIGQDKRVSCLFGEHLVSKYQYNPIALVEAPKTAIYGTLYFGFPELHQNFLWLAVYNLSSLNYEKIQALKGRDVYLFPDLSKGGKAYELWRKKAKDFEIRMPGTRFTVSDFLEQLAPGTDKQKGKDLADYLIELDHRLFRKQNIKKQQAPDSHSKSSYVENEDYKKNESHTKFLQSEIDTTNIESLPEQKTLEDIFKYYYKNGYKSLPVGIQINADNWKGNII